MADKLYVDIDKAVGLGYLSDWYQNSIDDTIAPIWTDEHLMELLNDFLVIPNDTPTAEFKEVKRGQWVECSNELNKYCSECKKVNGAIYHKPPFCENCGADMRGEEDG